MFFLNHNFFKPFLIIILLLTPSLASPAAVKFLGQPKKEKLIVRIDSNISSPAIGKIAKSTILEIVGKAYGWYKIILPKSISAYVWSKYLRLKTNGKAIAEVDNLNIRVKPSLNSYVIGKLNRGDEVSVIERKRNWYKVTPYPHAYGWVYAQMVNKIANLELNSKANTNISVKTKVPQNSQNKLIKNTATNPQYPPPVVSGTLEIFIPRNGCPANYCIRNTQGIILIKADALEVFNHGLLGRKVKVWGEVKKKGCVYLKATSIKQ